jgi:PAS domain S-box-containing protein
MLGHSTPEKLADGGITWYGFITDITESKQAEEALQRSETKFRTLYDSTSDAVILLDKKGFISCNKPTLKMFGYATLEEFCSKHLADLSPNEQPDGADSMVLAQQMIVTAMEKGSLHFEWMHKRNDTGSLPWNWMAIRFFRRLSAISLNASRRRKRSSRWPTMIS